MRAAIIMQNTAIGMTINTPATVIRFYRMQMPILISFRGELRESVACQVEMALHAKALPAQLNIRTCHFHRQADAEELPMILDCTFMRNKPVAILTTLTSVEACLGHRTFVRFAQLSNSRSERTVRHAQLAWIGTSARASA